MIRYFLGKVQVARFEFGFEQKGLVAAVDLSVFKGLQLVLGSGFQLLE